MSFLLTIRASSIRVGYKQPCVKSKVFGILGMMKAEIGLSTLFCLDRSFKTMIERVLETGITSIEVVDEGLHTLNPKRVETLRTLAHSYKLKYSMHSPFADINIASPSRPLLNAMIRRLKKSISYASDLDCQTWIFHPGLRTGISMFYPNREWTQNIRTSLLLFHFAEDLGVDAAVENVPEPFPFVMKSVDDFSRFYSEINEDIGLVLDIGHANINGQIESFLKTFREKIVHVHVHDNRGEHDEHLGIQHGNIEWQKVSSLLKRVPFNKTVVLESIEHVPESLVRLRQLLA